mgnify:CR=1 FL=1
MRMNPLFKFINQKKPKTCANITFKEAFLIIDHPSADPSPDLFPGLHLIEGHLRIDALTHIIDEVVSASSYSTNLCPAHYTERYQSDTGDDKLVVHVYFNLKGDILKIAVKNEDTEKSLAITDEQTQILQQKSTWAKNMLGELNLARENYLSQVAKRHNIKDTHETIYKLLKSKLLSSAIPEINSILTALIEQDLFTLGKISAETRFFEQLSQSVMQRQSAAKRHAGDSMFKFSVLAVVDDSASEHAVTEPTDSTSTVSESCQISGDEIAAKLAEARKAEISAAFSDLAKTITTCEAKHSFLQYHEHHLALITAYCMVDYPKKEYTPKQAALLEQAKMILANYTEPQRQLVSFALNGQIEELNLASNYIGGSANNVIRFIIMNTMQSTFAKTNDTHFANLLEYILTCDRFRNMGDFISSLLVEINGWTINLKQLLLFTKFEKSFLTLTRLCPQSMILSNNPALNTIRLMANSTDKDTIVQYLETGGPTSTFGQNVAWQLSLKSQLETNPKINGIINIE